MDHGDVMDQRETDILGSVTQTDGHYDVRDQTETDILGSVTQTGKQSDIMTCGSDRDRHSWISDADRKTKRHYDVWIRRRQTFLEQ